MKVSVFYQNVDRIGGVDYQSQAEIMPSINIAQKSAQDSVRDVLDVNPVILALNGILKNPDNFKKVYDLATQRHEELLKTLTGLARLEESEKYSKFLASLMSKLPDNVPGRLKLLAESAKIHLENLLARLKSSTSTRTAVLRNSLSH